MKLHLSFLKYLVIKFESYISKLNLLKIWQEFHLNNEIIFT